MPDFKNEEEEKEVIRIGIEASKHPGIITVDETVNYAINRRDKKIEELQARNIELYAQLSVVQSQNNQLATNFNAISANCDKLIIANENIHKTCTAAEEQARELTIQNDRLQASYTSLLAINDALQDKLKFTGMTQAAPAEDFKYMWIAVIVAGVFMGIIEIIQLIANLWQ